MEEKYSISVVGKELFPQRMHLEKEFGEVLYEQIITVLELIGEEFSDGGLTHYRLGVYLDSKNSGTRKFNLSGEAFDKIVDNFGHGFYNKLKDYSRREQKKGSEILFQLHQGNITLKDFDSRLNS
jgi:hypothetical protein